MTSKADQRCISFSSAHARLKNLSTSSHALLGDGIELAFSVTAEGKGTVRIICVLGIH